MRARVVGVGHRLGGDDAVGLEVVDRLRATGVPPGVELIEAPDPTALLSLFETPDPLIVVDAVVGAGAPGEVVVLEGAELGRGRNGLVSTHGMDVGGAIELGRVLFGNAVTRVLVVGVCIAPPRAGSGISREVEGGIGRAVEVVLEQVTEATRRFRCSNGRQSAT